MECLQNLFALVFDIFKIYLKFGLITVAIYLVAEWYILRYGDLDAHAQTQATKAPSNSTANKIFGFLLNFLIA